MDSLRRFGAIVGADLRERTRARGFWLLMALVAAVTWWSFPPTSAKYVVLALNGQYRALYSSAWVGMVVAMLSIWLSLLGFYLVRGTLVRDIETRVWQLLAATPMTRAGYLLAKWCSNMAVLLLIVAASLAVALAAQWVRAEDRAIDLIELLKPTVWIALPSLALTAAFAVWFDMLPLLRRTAGNVLYFVVWIAILAGTVPMLEAGPGGAAAGSSIGDPRGMALFQQAVLRQAAPQLAEPLHSGFCMGCGLAGRTPKTFRWTSWQVTWSALAGRAFWLLLALAAVAGAAPFLDRAAAHAGATRTARAQGGGRRLAWLDLLLAPLQRFGAGALIAAETQRNLRQRPLWWWCALLGAAGTGAFAPLPAAAIAVLASWMLLLDLYSKAALHERDSRTGAIVFSAPGAGRSVLLARWTMLAAGGCVATLPALLRFAFAAPMIALAMLAVSLSLATWALALGAVTRNARAFELLACCCAYIALNGAPLLNVAVAPLWTTLSHLAMLPLGAALLWWGWAGLRRA